MELKALQLDKQCAELDIEISAPVDKVPVYISGYISLLQWNHFFFNVNCLERDCRVTWYGRLYGS